MSEILSNLASPHVERRGDLQQHEHEHVRRGRNVSAGSEGCEHQPWPRRDLVRSWPEGRRVDLRLAPGADLRWREEAEVDALQDLAKRQLEAAKLAHGEENLLSHVRSPPRDPCPPRN